MKPEYDPFLRKALAIAGVVTLGVSCYATWAFNDKCFQLECLGVAWFAAGLCASILGLTPAVLFFPRFSSKPFIQRFVNRKWLYAFASMMVLFAWFVLLSSWEHWVR